MRTPVLVVLVLMELSNDVNSLLLYRICNLQQQAVPQWRIQVFPGRGPRVGNPKDGSANLLFWPFYSENCVKLKNIALGGGGCMSLVLPKIRHCVIVLHSQSSATHGMGPVRHFAKHRKNWHKVNFVENVL